MLGRWFIFAALCAAGGLVACGGASKKEAKDPLDDKPATTNDEVPKWEGASSPHPAETKQTKTSSGATINEAPSKRTDQYDKEGTEVVLKRAARQVQANCGAAKDDNGKATGPWGKATVMVQLGHNGRSKGVTVPDPYKGKPTGNCVEKAFSGLQFPPWQGSDAEVSWDIDIVEPGKEGKEKK